MTKQCNFRLSDKTLDDMDTIAAIRGTNRSEAMRAALAWLASEVRAVMSAVPAVPDWTPRSIPTTVGDWL